MKTVMQRSEFAERICRSWCAYYKPGKEEEISCAGRAVAERVCNAGHTADAVITADGRLLSKDAAEVLSELLCPVCAFQEDGCDFIETLRSSGYDAAKAISPCGGLLFLARSVGAGLIDIAALRKVVY